MIGEEIQNYSGASHLVVEAKERRTTSAAAAAATHSLTVL
jgi:hypothetical protein